MKKIFASLLFLVFSFAYAQDSLFVSKELSINKYIDGTLLLPKDEKASHLAIIIAGSGPTDRNGNQNFMKNNSLKKLAEGLTHNGIATFRYDKRSVKLIRTNNTEMEIKFDDFVADAVSILQYFEESSQFKSITIIGHSQGSLIGILASQNGADKFISIAGAGQTIDEVITFQVGKSMPAFLDDTKRVFGIMKTGETTKDYPPQLASIFNDQVQPFIMNWMQYNPQEELKKLDIPILLINGTKDLQVTVDEANLLSEANPNAILKIVENMNHIMFIIEGDDLENAKSYNESSRPISEEAIKSILAFIKGK